MACRACAHIRYVTIDLFHETAQAMDIGSEESALPVLTPNLKIYLAIVAIVVAVLLLALDQNISQGTGIIVAPLAAGAGWLVRDTNDEARANLTG